MQPRYDNIDLVSVIIPLFNAEEYILETLTSVFKQDYRPIEVIIVDDGSNDNSVSIIKKFITDFSSSDFKVTLIKNTKKGAPSARNYGLLISKGNLIQFLDSDDILLPDKIKTQVEKIKDSNFDIVYSKAQHIDNKGNLLPYFWGRELQGNSSDYFEFPWQTMCALYKKDIIYRIGLWNENLNMNQDWEFALKFVINKCNISFLDKVQAYYRTGLDNNIGKNISSNKIDSKFESTRNIYNLNKQYDNMDSYLKKKFFKRFIFIAVEYGKISEWNKIKIIKQFIKTEGLVIFPINFLLYIKNSFIFKLITNLYNIKNKNRY